MSRNRNYLIASLLILTAAVALAQKSTPVVLTVNTEPNAIVWIDEIRRGTTDSGGKLRLAKLKPGRHTLRVRAMGFKEATTPLLPGRREITVKLLPTSDEAELTFQQGEAAREKARDDAALQQAADLYRKAIALRPAFPAAHVGLARVLLDLNQFNDALAEIAAARRTRRVYPEASAVEGRINHEAAFDDEAIKSFRRSIQEAKGFQPEAHVGLARVLEEKGQNAEAIAAYRKAIDQLSESEPIIYQMLGAAYEKTQQYKEAVGAYEKYLQLAPNGSLAPAVRSIVDQLKRGGTGQDEIPCCD
jgi:tetratricopeptide (TPR) repeat protein